MEEDLKKYFSRILRKEFTGVVDGISGKKRFLVRFQYGCEKYLTSNQLTVVIVEKSTMTEETDVLRISEKPNDTVPLEKLCYCVCFCVVQFQ